MYETEHTPADVPGADDVEAVGPSRPDLIEKFDDAQRRAIRLMRDTINSIEPGMTEYAIIERAKLLASAYPFDTWFHEPEVWFDGRKRGLRYRPDDRRPLQPGMLVSIDLAPATDEVFGDVGVTFAYGTDEEPQLVTEARELCFACCDFASRFKCVGEVYVFADSFANNHRKSLGDARAVGHSCFPNEGITGILWPLASRAAIRLKRNQVQWYNPRRFQGVYAMSPMLHDKDGRAVLFEEMVVIDGDFKKVLGRDSIDEIGTW